MRNGVKRTTPNGMRVRRQVALQHLKRDLRDCQEDYRNLRNLNARSLALMKKECTLKDKIARLERRANLSNGSVAGIGKNKRNR